MELPQGQSLKVDSNETFVKLNLVVYNSHLSP
jgi:hypothetical protein